RGPGRARPAQQTDAEQANEACERHGARQCERRNSQEAQDAWSPRRSQAALEERHKEEPLSQEAGGPRKSSQRSPADDQAEAEPRPAPDRAAPFLEIPAPRDV